MKIINCGLNKIIYVFHSFNNLNEVFKEIQDTNKGINLVISHQERILNIADNIILLNNGKVEKVGKPKDIENAIFTKAPCCKLGGEI